jgi:carbonyl reductase 1
MTSVAVVTGANQGLGLALVEGLCRTLGPDAIVYLTARDPERGEAAAAALRDAGLAPRYHALDVAVPGSIDGFARHLEREHGGVDIVLSNAAARITRDHEPAGQVRNFILTNNLGTTRMLTAIGPLLRDGGRFVVVASSFGSLRHLAPALHPRFDEAATLDDIDTVMLRYADAVEQGGAEAEGWPAWINIASKVGQVAAVRLYARSDPAALARRDLAIAAACPGLVDTAASRPWFEDMSAAQTPEAAAVDVVWLATAGLADRSLRGELIRHRVVVPWH